MATDDEVSLSLVSQTRQNRKRVPGLRESLLRVQQDLRTIARPSALIVLAGVDAAGRSESANVLNQWMDQRWIVTRAWREPSDEEREQP